MTSTHDEQAVNRIDDFMVAHPALFGGREFKIRGPFLPAGWYAIAEEMACDLENMLGDAAHRFRPIQSKEKWGSWRFYWRLDRGPGEESVADDRLAPYTADIATNSPSGHQDVTNPSTDEHMDVSDTPMGMRMSFVPSGELRRAIYARVRKAEAKTESTCMWCGAPGSAWTNGWVHVACEGHRRRHAITLEEWHRRL